jgi:PAS domain-containing protein
MDRASDDGARERRLEEALKESEERFRRLVEAAKDYAIFMVDAHGV